MAMTRRGGLTSDQKKRVRLTAAHRRIGARYTYRIELWKMVGGPVVKLLALAAVAGALVWAWLHVSHLLLAVSTAGLAVAVAVAWLAWTGSMKATLARMSGSPRGAGLGRVVAVLCGL